MIDQLNLKRNFLNQADNFKIIYKKLSQVLKTLIRANASNNANCNFPTTKLLKV